MPPEEAKSKSKFGIETIGRIFNEAKARFEDFREKRIGPTKGVLRFHFIDIGKEAKSYQRLRDDIVNIEELNKGRIQVLTTIESKWNETKGLKLEIEKSLQSLGPYLNPEIRSKEIGMYVNGTGRIQKEIEILGEKFRFWIPFVERLRYPDGYIHEIACFGYQNLHEEHGWIGVIKSDIDHICDKMRSKYYEEELENIKNGIEKKGNINKVKEVYDKAVSLIDKYNRGSLIEGKDIDEFTRIATSDEFKGNVQILKNIGLNIEIIYTAAMNTIKTSNLIDKIKTTEGQIEGWLKGHDINLKRVSEEFRVRLASLRVDKACNLKIHYEHTYKVVKTEIYDEVGYPKKVLREDGTYELKDGVYQDIGNRDDVEDEDGEVIGKIIDHTGKPKKGVMRIILPVRGTNRYKIIKPPHPLLKKEDVERCLNIQPNDRNLLEAKNDIEFWERNFYSLHEKVGDGLSVLRGEGEYKVGCDRNGWPLEVDEEGNVLLDKWEGRAVRKVKDKDFIEDTELLQTANWINNEYDAMRDDWRDGRYHPESLTSTDYAMASNPPYIVPSLLNWRDGRYHPESLTSTDYAMASNPPYIVPSLLKRAIGKGWEWKPKGEKILDNPSEKAKFRSYRMITYGSGNRVVQIKEGIRKPTNLDPVFERRALDKGWYYIGRKYYYDTPWGINNDFSGGVIKKNEDPAVSTRGLAMYIIDRITREEEKMEKAREALKSFGGFDYGPRAFPGKGKRGKFPEDPFDLDENVREANE